MNTPSKLRPEHTEGSECTCESEIMHALMVAEVDESFKQDPARYKMRQDRNTYALRAAVLAQTNGHS